MAGELRNFDPDKVTVSWAVTGGGVVDLTLGLVDEATAIQEAKDAPAWSHRTDRQGNAVRNKMRKKSGTLTLTYVAESEIQKELTRIYLIDDTLEDQIGVITIKDLNGSTLMVYNGAYIENDPDLGYGSEAANRTYVFGYAERVPSLQGSEAL